MMRSASRSDTKAVELSQGTIRYAEHGSGEPVVFVHGLLVSGALWRKVVPELPSGMRMIVPEWPLGSHRVPMRAEADLSPPGLARLIVDFLDALDLSTVTLVGNDTGGALCQIVVATRPDRVARLVLTPCDAYENFLPPMFRYLTWSARIPGAFTAVVQTLRLRRLRTLPLAYGWLAKHRIEPAVLDAWVGPVLSDGAVRRDTTKVLRGISSRYTLAAAERFRTFDRPVLLAWAPEDRFFPLAHARRMADAFPRARLATIDDAYTFVPEDQPRRLAELIRRFVAEPASCTA